MKNTHQRVCKHGMGLTSRSLAGMLLVLWLILSWLSGCAVHPGGAELAFIRNGELWTIQSDGTEAAAIATGGVVSFAWSPDHHQLVFRYGPTAYRAAAAINALSPRGAPDQLSDLAVISVSGGSPLQITPGVQGLVRSDAWWNADGNRLIYREQVSPAGQSPVYIMSQADQPVGIARKTLLDAASLPVLSPDGSQVAVIDPLGNVRVGEPGATGKIIASGAVLTQPATGRPARLLWQPHHDALLYAAASGSGVTLVLHDLDSGHTRQIGTAAALLDAAFSPDGTQLLLRTPLAFEVWDVRATAKQVFTWPDADSTALPYWSPDGHRILVQDAGGWTLVDMAHKTVRPLLTHAATAGAAATGPQTLWHPATGSPWKADGSAAVFVGASGDQWLGAAMPKPQGSKTGLYVAGISTDAVGAAKLIDSGADRSPSWSYLDPSTTFLVAG